MEIFKAKVISKTNRTVWDLYLLLSCHNQSHIIVTFMFLNSFDNFAIILNNYSIQPPN